MHFVVILVQESGQERLHVSVFIVSWPSVSVCLALGVSCSVCSSRMVVRTLGLRLSGGILLSHLVAVCSFLC